MLPSRPAPLPYQNFLTGVAADSKLPIHLVEEMVPLLDRCEDTFVAPPAPAPVPSSPCTTYARLDAHVYPC